MEGANFTSSIVRPLIAFTNALAYIAICLFGGWLIVRNESVSVGIVVTILLYAKQFSGPLEQIAGGLGDLQHAKAAARRVFKLLDLPEEPQADGALPAPAKGDVRFEHVSFSYDPAVPLIEDLNLAVRPGQHLALYARGAWQQMQNSPAHRALAAAGFPHKAERAPRMQRERHVAHHVERAFAGVEPHGDAFRLQQRGGGGRDWGRCVCGKGHGALQRKLRIKKV